MTTPFHVRTYSELSGFRTFEERFDYLRLNGTVGADTFGFDRRFNQIFYRSTEWKRVRDIVITRDCGCDLGIDGRAIPGRILIHHMNPITMADILEGSDRLLNPENLICVSHDTHNAIHYGDISICGNDIVERRPGDTILWKRIGHSGGDKNER